jgi:hypothetical protein
MILVFHMQPKYSVDSGFLNGNQKLELILYLLNPLYQAATRPISPQKESYLNSKNNFSRHGISCGL